MMNESTSFKGVVLPAQWHNAVSNQPLATIAISISLVLCVAIGYWQISDVGQPKQLSEPIPFLYNTWQFLNDNYGFMQRVIEIFQTTNIAKFYLGGTPTYILSGPENVKLVFGRSAKVGTEKIFTESVLPKHYKLPPAFVQRFVDDKSGRGRNPAPGSEHVDPETRYWARYGHIHTEYLARTQNLQPIMEAFREIFAARLDRYELGKWESIGVVDFCRRDMTESAIGTLIGPGIFETCPEFGDVFWDFDEHIFALTLGFPRWLHAAPYRSQDRYLDVLGRHAQAALREFDWSGPDAETHWEPLLGARVSRELCKWFQECKVPDVSIAGALGTLLFADPSLLDEVRREVQKAWTTNPETGKDTLDTQVIATLPLLQSVFTEVLRLHMNFNVIRHVREPLQVGGYTLPVSSMVQLPMMTAHYDETVWSSQGHPATEFWAERHIKHVEETDQDGNTSTTKKFATAGRPSSYFPFGGGVTICPGRHFAKNEILCAIGLLVTKFDIEFERWESFDGSRFMEHPAENDKRYCGFGSQPPDREMKLRIRRRS